MIYDKSIAHKVAEYLLEIKAIQLNPVDMFTWASGIQSPIYCDNRKSLSFPAVRSYIKNAFSKIIKEHFPNAEYIAGVATAGIPHGALIADSLQLPYVYVRSKPKAHGLKNQIEGALRPNAKVVVIEDLFSTGGSCLKAVEALRNEAGAEILTCGAIFSYGFPKIEKNFKEGNCDYFALSNFASLMELPEIKNQFAEQIDFMKNWYVNMQ